MSDFETSLIQFPSADLAVPSGQVLHPAGGKDSHKSHLKVRDCLFPYLGDALQLGSWLGFDPLSLSELYGSTIEWKEKS